MKNFLFGLFIILYFPAFSQSFTELETKTNFIQMNGGSVAIADVDGDGDEDILQSGLYCNSEPTIQLYLNEGDLHFVDAPNSDFFPSYNGDIDFADIDNDGDQDVLIMGYEETSSNAKTRLYINDGQGHFQEDQNTNFEDLADGTIEFSDIDNDGDQDVLLTGETSDDEPIPTTKLYENDGLGNFTEIVNTPFVDVEFSLTAFVDIDGDSIEELFLFGRDSTSNYLSKIYKNDGAGQFSEFNSHVVTEGEPRSISFSDIDQDGDMDFLVIGRISAIQTFASFYVNDGNGSFEKKDDTTIEPRYTATILFFDMDDDGDEDLLICGYTSENLTNLYSNDGTGQFTEVVQSEIEDLNYTSLDVFDPDNDGDLDIFITGRVNLRNKISALFYNDGDGVFKKQEELNRVSFSSIDYSDIDNDGDNDVLIVGRKCFTEPVFNLYVNDGLGNLTERKEAPFIGVEQGSVDFVDIDGDNDEDVLITGFRGTSERVARLYRNDGMGNFEEDLSNPFTPVSHSAAAFADIDNDGDHDVLIAGKASITQGGMTKLYTNDGLGNFTEVQNTPFINVENSAIDFSDIDLDGDLDVFIAGGSSDNFDDFGLYENDGNGIYTEISGTDLDGVNSGDAEFSDLDNDGDEDLLVIGQGAAYLYINDGLGNFTTMAPNSIFDGVTRGDIEISDFDNDGDNDVLMTGDRDFIEPSANLYINKGGNVFKKVDVGLVGVVYSQAAFVDLNGDEGEDIIITGAVDEFSPQARVYLNDNITSLKPIEPVVESKIDIFPNPSGDDDLNLSIPNANINHFQVDIFDFDGKLVKRLQPTYANNLNRQLDISLLVKGGYVLRVTTDSGMLTSKFVIQ